VILAVVDDLLVSSRIMEAAKYVGASVETIDGGDDAVTTLGSRRPALLVIDLATPGTDLRAIAATARLHGIPVVGFYPHVDVELRKAAQRAGIEHVYARSRFLRETAVILGERLEDVGSRK
jgi:CheY-like chemotaxis protein